MESPGAEAGAAPYRDAAPGWPYLEPLGDLLYVSGIDVRGVEGRGW
jgi:hypothetical protein